MKSFCKMKVKISEEVELIEQKKVMNLNSYCPSLVVGSVRISEIDILSSHLVGIEPEEDVPSI